MALSSVIMPKLGMYTDDILLLEWSVAEGAPVARGEIVFVLETEKTTAEVEAEADGFLHRTVEAGAKVAIGAEVGVLAATRREYDALVGPGEPVPAAVAGDDGADAGNPFLGYIGGGGPAAIIAGPVTPPAPAVVVPAGPARARADRALASPRALAALARHGAAPETARAIHGTGPGGRVIERDVLAYLSAGSAPAASAAGAGGVLERRPLRGRRGTIARRMVESLQASAQLTSVLEIDASPLVTARERLNAEGPSPRVSYTALFVSLLATALRRQPLLNSRIAGDEIELLADVNIGVAVDTPDGLIVPVVHRADTLSIHEVNARIGELVDRARAGTLALADVESGTFTLSNAGIHPVDITTAILNPPQSALLWVGRIRERPIVIDGGLHIRPTVQACLTFDHRAIDGAPAAEFLGTVEELVRELAAER
jgi:pyruvate/2-oxoglutarate dehydrogenase complex dihydrolipoamide acyltransferase (E2) component